MRLRHQKTQTTYVLLGPAYVERDGVLLWAYASPSGVVWLRPEEEVTDGRFVPEGIGPLPSLGDGMFRDMDGIWGR